MKFGKLEGITGIDYDFHRKIEYNISILESYKNTKPFSIITGFTKWTRNDLKDFFPRGIKDELTYYATQFESVELNATFYRMPSIEQILLWKSKVPSSFKFFPKIPAQISHYRRLNNVKELVEDFCFSVSNFEENLGTIFIQLHDNFKPKDLDKLISFLNSFPKGLKLAVEIRNEEWFQKSEEYEQYLQVMIENKFTNIVVDTPGRRDVLHMNLTNDELFLRFVTTNSSDDYKRLDYWAETIKELRKNGLNEVNVFIHQQIDASNPFLGEYLKNKVVSS